MSTPTKDAIIEQLRTVDDPELHQDIVTLNMVRNVTTDGGNVVVEVELTTPACPMKGTIRRDVEAAVGRVPGVTNVSVEFSARVRGQAKTVVQMPGVKNVIAVGAGKGGVGKSTVAALLAVGLKREGARVGLLDADVYGPSIPTLMGVEGSRLGVRDDKIIPIEAVGVKLISIGFFIDPEQAVVWRGPMVHGAVQQFLGDVDWGELDYLVVDLPPGTGDVPLTLSQSIPMTGSVIVCTPQDLALSDARRAIMMYEKLNVPCLGIVENMSYYVCPNCRHRDAIFDHGGAKRAAGELNVPFLGEIPLNADLRVFADEGTPQKCFNTADDELRAAVTHVVRAVAGQVSVRASMGQAQPTLSVE
ncbi:MAG: Mrp/NBP35 family ATP-binding protein [Phycisphaerales bacterium]|nr:MAG: Mrp/NBP35 family ATP-binding protein [Phycisphaerales bacterium]